ncbi:MAG: SDR family oxidoreductase [Lentisphaeria bacterium]|nr:SDR family oxidoreductase [Lentisphaeria bacterium]
MHVKELLSLKAKVCLVTGGAGRYGKCIVEGLAEADGTVITASRNLEANQKVANAFRERGLDVHALALDQADHASVLALKTALAEQFGGLDVFVNNSVARPMKGYNAPLEQWEESMRVNATGMFDLTREMTDLLIERGGGSIIHISSMMGMFGPDLSNYEGTDMGDPAPDYFFHNAGLLNYARYQSHVLAEHNIRANCISPGGLAAAEIQPERFVQNYTKKVLCGHRMANPDDIKGVAVFLASQASAYITGENILMDGGMHC